MKLLLYQFEEGIPGKIFIFSRELQSDLRALSRSQSQNAQNTFPIDLISILLDPHRGLKAIRKIDELHGRPGMQSKLVLYGDSLFDHLIVRRELFRLQQSAYKVNIFLPLFHHFHGDIFEVVAPLHGSKFNQHGKIHPCNDLYLVVIKKTEA